MRSWYFSFSFSQASIKKIAPFRVSESLAAAKRRRNLSSGRPNRLRATRFSIRLKAVTSIGLGIEVKQAVLNQLPFLASSIIHRLQPTNVILDNPIFPFSLKTEAARSKNGFRFSIGH